MKNLNQNGFRPLKLSSLIFSLLLSLLILSGASGKIRAVEISSYVQPSSPEARSYFASEYRYGGGVVPRGGAEFSIPGGTKVRADQLQLVILDENKLRNPRRHYDAIGIRWNGEDYQLMTQDDLIYPLMKFVKRGSYIAFTIPVLGIDQNYLQRNALVPFRETLVGMGHVAKEFNSRAHAEFLEQVDFAEVMKLDPSLIQSIIRDLRSGNLFASDEGGTYVNADFHVKYQVFLENTGGRKAADVGGLPLRYHFVVGRNGKAIIHDVDVFRFPTEEAGLQPRAVLFFQTAAILRQFKQDNEQEFNRFLNELSRVIERR